LDVTDRLFCDFDIADVSSTEDSFNTRVEIVHHEPFGLLEAWQRPTAVAGTLGRVDEDETEWLMARDDEEDAVDEIFADLFGDDSSAAT
jgi:hypothetical protein